MNKRTVYVHAENSRELQKIEVPEDATISQIIEIYLKEYPNNGAPEEIEIFLENDHRPKDKNHDCSQAEIPKNGHIHCHRCSKVEISVVYNGDEKNITVPPSTTTSSILKKVIQIFGISESDSGDYLLKLNDSTILSPNDHIGSFTAFPHCRVKLFLTPTKPVQG